MIRPLVDEEGEPEVLACVVAEKQAYYDRCTARHDGIAVKERVNNICGGDTTCPLAHSSAEAASALPSKDEICGDGKAPVSSKTAEQPAVGETSALLPSRLLRSRSKKIAVIGEGESHGAYGGVISLVGDADYPEADTPLANRVLSCLIAMLQGVEVLCNLAILYLYKDDFLLDPAILAVAMGALKVPWTIKPLWALMSDNLPLFGYRRKSYIFIGSSLCIFALLSLGLFGYRSLWTTTVLLFLYFAGSAMCNVIGEALVVEAGRKAVNDEGAANSVSVFFAFRKISFAIMSYLSGFLLAYMDKRFVFVLGTALPAAVFFTNFFLTETRAIVLPLKEQLHRLFEIMKKPVVLNSTLFIFLMMSTPSAGSIMFYYMTNELKFGPELLGRMALFQSIASLFGILTYWWLFRKTNLRKLLLFSTLLVTPFCMLPVILVQRWNVKIGIADTAFVVTDTVLMEFVGELQTMPILVLGARLCPPGLESSIYSFLLSAYNLGLGFGSLLSAGMTAAYGISSRNFENLTSMIIVCALTNLLPLGVLSLIPDSLSSTVEEGEGGGEADSGFTSDTEAGSSQISTRSASEVEKGAKRGSSRRTQGRSPSDSGDSDIGITSCCSRQHHSDSMGSRGLRDRDSLLITSSSSSYTLHGNALAATAAVPALENSAREAAAPRLHPATAGHVEGAAAAATVAEHTDTTAATSGLPAGHGGGGGAPAQASPRSVRQSLATAAFPASAAAPAAVDVMAAVMESGGSGECTGARLPEGTSTSP